MNLRELCEPLFLFVCRLHRSGRKGRPFDFRRARSEIDALFAEMKLRAAARPDLHRQYEAVAPALVYFVDSIIAESDLPFAAKWDQDRLAYDQQETAGDERFFDILDDTLEDTSSAAAERLAVLYTCMGLGFTGCYAGQPDYLRSKMVDCSIRLRNEIDADEKAPITPDAYEYLDTRDLIEPPGAKLGFIAVFLLSMIVAALLIAGWAYQQASSQLADDLDQIVNLAGSGEESSE